MNRAVVITYLYVMMSVVWSVVHTIDIGFHMSIPAQNPKAVPQKRPVRVSTRKLL